MSLSADAAGTRTIVLPPPPPPSNDEERRRMAAAIATAERERAASGGPQHAQTDEVPHEVRSGETLMDISRIYGGHLPEVMSANPQIEEANQIRPGEVVFVPSHDPQTIRTREQVAEAEAAD